MIGLICSLAAWIPAWLIARRESRHNMIATTFATAGLWSYATSTDPTWPRFNLAAMALIPLCAAVAYSEQWDPDVGTSSAQIAAIDRRLRRVVIGVLTWGCFAAFVALAPEPQAWWFYASWAPYVVSVGMGWTLLAKWAKAKYFYSPSLRFLGGNSEYQPDVPWTISQRIAALMLCADTVGLALVNLPGHSEAIGRASLILIAVYQIAWLLKNRSSASPPASD